MIASLDPNLVEIVWLSLKVSLSAVLFASLLALPLGAAVAVAVPKAFVAVTRTRIVRPTSLATRTYELDVAPAMLEQLPPVELQRRHW